LRTAGSAGRLNRHALQNRGDVGCQIGGVGSGRQIALGGGHGKRQVLTVVGREKISVRAGTYNAIKLDLKLKRIGKHLELEPHKKFRRASIWVSDDAERLLLRIEAQIFVGTVFADLQSVHFDNPR